jgi:hypothetical protein
MIATSATLRESPLQTDLHLNPFAVLGATVRDDRRRIVLLADERALELDQALCQKARADLTNPRARLHAEVGWLLGVDPAAVPRLLARVANDPVSLRQEPELSPLAHANLLSAAFEAADVSSASFDVAAFIGDIAAKAAAVTPAQVLHDVNLERERAGFPQVQTPDVVQAELAERKRHFRDVIVRRLNEVLAPTLVSTMTRIVDHGTAGGSRQAPELIDELVDAYEVGIQGFLQNEAANVDKLVQAVRGCAKAGEGTVAPLVDELSRVTRNWDGVAQPSQLSRKARGMHHMPSVQLAGTVRNLAVELCNTHNMLQQSRRLTQLLQDVFAELPEMAERVAQDAGALDGIAAQRGEWAREITYSVEVGLLFKSAFSLSPEQITWKEYSYPLEAIRRVRWGAVRRTGRVVYLVAFGNHSSEAVMELGGEHLFSAIVGKLWRAVGARLMTELVRLLKAGHGLNFGDAVVHDDGITLVKRGSMFRSDAKVRCAWADVKMWQANGACFIGAKNDQATYVGLSYAECPNAHVLEQTIRLAFGKPGMQRLSDLLPHG